MNSKKPKTVKPKEAKKKTTLQTFGRRLKAYRKASGVTQENLATYIDRSSEAVSKMERGIVFPGVEILIRISEYLKVSLDELVGHDSESSVSPRKSRLMAEATVLIRSMDEDKLSVAVEQLKALRTL